MEKGQNRSFKGKKDNKGCVDSPEIFNEFGFGISVQINCGIAVLPNTL